MIDLIVKMCLCVMCCACIGIVFWVIIKGGAKQ